MNRSPSRVRALLTLALTGLLLFPTMALAREISKAQAISRVRTIISRNAAPCRITQTESVAAIRMKAGWRVNARIRLSGRFENAVWIVSGANGATAQNQLTAEIENGCS